MGWFAQILITESAYYVGELVSMVIFMGAITIHLEVWAHRQKLVVCPHGLALLPHKCS